MKTPDFFWSEYDTPILGDVALRILQTYQQSEVTWLNKVYLSELYANGDRRFLRTIRPTGDPIPFAATIPTLLSDAGYGLRYFSIKHNAYGVVAEANWTVELQQWVPD